MKHIANPVPLLLGIPDDTGCLWKRLGFGSTINHVAVFAEATKMFNKITTMPLLNCAVACVPHITRGWDFFTTA